MKIAARGPLLCPRLLAAAASLLLLLLAGCGSSSLSASGASPGVLERRERDLADRRGRGRERVRERARTDRRQVREGHGDREQPEHRPAHLRGECRASRRRSAGAKLLIENGVGYDTFMSKIESASPDSSRRVINVQKLLGLPESTPNPHLWYKPSTMPAVAKAIVGDLSALEPAHAAYFEANDAAFEASLQPWLKALAQFSKRYPGTPRRDDRAGRRLHARGGRDREPDALHHAGRHHERHRSGAPGRDACRTACSPGTR